MSQVYGHTVHTLSEVLGVTENTVRRWIKEGRLNVVFGTNDAYPHNRIFIGMGEFRKFLLNNPKYKERWMKHVAQEEEEWKKSRSKLMNR